MLFSIALGLLGSASFATIQTKDFEYEQGGQTMLGYLAWDDSKTGPRPGVMIVHDWDGLNDYEKLRARMVAELGYVALAADIYGKDNRPKSQQENGQKAQQFYKDPALFRARLQAGIDALRTVPEVDDSKVAAMGYCFGGAGVMELARSGSDIRGIVSFHGGMTTQMPAKEGEVKCKWLVCHAAQDPSAPRDVFVKWLDEMQAAKVDYRLLAFNLNVHPFTVIGGSSYNEEADKESWKAMVGFYEEIFK
jgi:dienelactone hydrolase